MKKFGFSRSNKEKSGSDDRSSKNSSPANGNPYAQNAQADPYTSPPPYSGSSDSFRNDKTPVPVGGYGSGVRPQERFSAAPVPSGYGSNSNRYGTPSNDGEPAPSRYGGGGYGGFGAQSGGAPPAGRYGAPPAAGDTAPAPTSRYGSQSQPEPTNSRYGASAPTASRYGQQSAMNAGIEQDAQSQNQWESGRGPSYGQATSGDYGAYQDRQLTAEEQEEEDVLAAKQEIKFIKQSDVSSTRNALRIAAQAEETGRSTLERLGAQGERIHNTERNLDLASNQNRLAAEKAREISTLNRSMFAVHVSNPFTSGKA